MDGEKFVDALRRYVGDVAVESTILNLKDPPGKRASEEDKLLLSWYRSLTYDEVEYVRHVISAAVHATLFGFLVALDGDRK
ncbi:hypothetical protein [Pannonibacter phragmitetus]|uniref:hypothetical protein n=1 Tax=Pannonibacter phragmitetus TaxID=121719 RepID=UPI00128F2159|nr:hypothetical protein [Pannonibacter phragmitetus]